MGINNLHSGCVHSILIARHASKSDNEVTKLFQPMFASLYMMVQNQDMLSANFNIDIHNIYVLYMHTYKNIFMLQLHQSPYWLLSQHSYNKSLRLSNRFPEKRLTICSVTVEQAPNGMSVVCNEVFFSLVSPITAGSWWSPMGAMTEVLLEKCSLNAPLSNLYWIFCHLSLIQWTGN